MSSRLSRSTPATPPLALLTTRFLFTCIDFAWPDCFFPGHFLFESLAELAFARIDDRLYGNDGGNATDHDSFLCPSVSLPFERVSAPFVSDVCRLADRPPRRDRRWRLSTGFHLPHRRLGGATMSGLYREAPHRHRIKSSYGCVRSGRGAATGLARGFTMISTSSIKLIRSSPAGFLRRATAREKNKQRLEHKTCIGGSIPDGDLGLFRSL